MPTFGPIVLALTIAARLMTNQPSLPIVTYSGPVSGSQNMQASTTLTFTTEGVYTFTVTATMTLKITAAAAGCTGGNGGAASNGGGGGQAGAVNITGQNQSFASGTTYEVRVGTTAQTTYVKVQAGAQINQLQNGCAGGAVLTGTGVAGTGGGAGGTWNSVAPGGSAAGINANGAGGGGGAGTAGSIQLGGGGSGGGAGNGTADHDTPPGLGDQGGNGLGRTIGTAGSRGYGGGGGASGTSSGSIANAPGAAALALTFVSRP